MKSNAWDSSDCFKSYLPYLPETITHLEGDSIILLEVPHALTTHEERHKLMSRLALLFHHQASFILLPQDSDPKSDYYKYADSLWKWSSKNVEPLERIYAHFPFKENCEGPVIGLFTSGSTGTPKLLWHAPYSFYLAIQRSQDFFNVKEDTKILSSLPCYHNGGFLNLWREAYLGAKITTVHHKELISTWKALSPDVVIGVPTQLLYGLEAVCPKAIFYSGGAALDKNLWRKAKSKGYEVIGTYGLTETCGMVMGSTEPETPMKACHDCELSLSQEETLLVKSPSLYLFKQSKDTFEKSESSLQTEDLARVTIIEGTPTFNILGRRDQMLIYSGENISPGEIESVVRKFTDDITYKVIGINDNVKGDMPVLFIEGFEDWSREKRNELAEFIKENISPLKRPRLIAELPRLDEYAKGIKPTLEDYKKKLTSPNEPFKI